MWLEIEIPSAVVSYMYHIHPHATASLGRILLRPLAADALRILLVLLVVLRDVRRERVVRVRRAEERLHGEQHRADLEGRRPLVCYPR